MSDGPHGGGQVRVTRQRRAVSSVLDDIDGFRSAQQIHELLRSRGDKVGLTTVYRTLQAMADADEVDVLRADDGESLYRQCSSGGHHHHLVCRTCGHTEDVDCAASGIPCLEPVDGLGFAVDEAQVTFWGTCPTCQSHNQERP